MHVWDVCSVNVLLLRALRAAKELMLFRPSSLLALLAILGKSKLQSFSVWSARVVPNLYFTYGCCSVPPPSVFPKSLQICLKQIRHISLPLQTPLLSIKFFLLFFVSEVYICSCPEAISAVDLLFLALISSSFLFSGFLAVWMGVLNTSPCLPEKQILPAGSAPTQAYLPVSGPAVITMVTYGCAAFPPFTKAVFLSTSERQRFLVFEAFVDLCRCSFSLSPVRQ